MRRIYFSSIYSSWLHYLLDSLPSNRPTLFPLRLNCRTVLLKSTCDFMHGMASCVTALATRSFPETILHFTVKKIHLHSTYFNISVLCVPYRCVYFLLALFFPSACTCNAQSASPSTPIFNQTKSSPLCFKRTLKKAPCCQKKKCHIYLETFGKKHTSFFFDIAVKANIPELSFRLGSLSKHVVTVLLTSSDWRISSTLLCFFFFFFSLFFSL